MRALRSLSRAMFSGFVRDRSALVFTIAIPVLFLALFGSIYKGTSSPRVTVLEVGRVPLLDQARAADPAQLGKILEVTRATSLAAALADVRKGSYDATVQQHGATVLVRYSIADQTTAGIVQSVFTSIIAQADQAQADQALAGQAGGSAHDAFQLRASQVEDNSLKPIQYLAPGLLGWAIASGAAFGAAITLVTWRRDKLLRRLRLAPVSTGSIVLARVGVSMVIAVIQLAVFLALATTPYFGLKLTSAWWMSIPIIMAGTLAFMSIGLLIGAFARSQQAATSIANLVILPMAFLGGAFIPLDFAPAWIRDVSYAMPLRYLVTGMQDVMARGEGPAAGLPAIGILLALAAALTLIAVRVFRWDDV
jgi:ABC-2 type transport system permease protein